MAAIITYELIKQAVDLVHNGLEAARIQQILGVTISDWQRIVQSHHFSILLHRNGAKTKRDKLRAIERELFELIEVYHEKGKELTVIDYDRVVKRIDELTFLYSTFLL